jgi:hypothetical protein
VPLPYQFRTTTVPIQHRPGTTSMPIPYSFEII